MSVSIEQIKELREATGVSMMACKSALEEANGEAEKAIEILRKKGEAKAADRATKSTGQGAISQELIGKIKQAVGWVSNNQELVELGQVENLTSPQAVAISDPIKPDFDGANFTNG